MNFRYVNPHNVSWLVPQWASNPFELASCIEEMISEAPIKIRTQKWNSYRKFYLDLSNSTEGMKLRMGIANDEQSEMLCGNLIIHGDTFDMKVPLNYLFKGSPKIADGNCLYYHSFASDVPLGYFGITKRRWFDRLAQHFASSAKGSPYLFHKAMRQHADKRMMHTVVICGLDRDEVMKWEEHYVARMTLYPLGLNMIPGGYAGLRYLHSLGIRGATEANRDEVLEELTSRESLAGRPNPLCAARWESDQDFVNRIICGHSGRLTLDEIRRIREMDLSGYTVPEISGRMGRAAKRVAQVIRGKTYRRVA